MNIGDIINVGTSAVGGGLFGVLGQVANRAFGIWEAKEKRKDQVLAYEQEAKRWINERELIALQMKQTAEANEQAIDLADSKGGWEGLSASYTAEASVRESYRWVEAVRALARPFLTLLGQMLLAIVFFTVKASRPDLVAQITDAEVFAATASLLWWFGERNHSRSKT